MLKTSKELSLRAKTIIALACFAVVFAGLTVVATFYDLDISRILTKHSLSEGEYISHNGFALLFETIGCCPIYLMGSIAGAIVFWFFWRKSGKLRILSVIGIAAAVAGFTLTIKDLFGYAAEYIGANLTDGSLVLAAHKLAGAGYLTAVSVVVGAMPAVCLLVAWGRIAKSTNDKMIWWAIAIVGTMIFFFVPHFIKGPVGRARFRTMNYLGDFDYYTRWYVLNGKRVLTADGIVASTAETKAAIIVASDTCKSFPSGHTFSAGMIYTLLGLPYVSEKCAKKGVKLTLWLCTVAYVGLVAVSRIVAGAHFMSDVLFGGTIAFAGAMIMREIFVCKGCHVKALFGKQAAVEAQAAAPETTEEVAQEEAAETTDEEGEALSEDLPKD